MIKQNFFVFGANTNVGKTLFSSCFSKYFSESLNQSIFYIKPIQTGYPKDSDEKTIVNFCENKIKTKTILSYESPISPHRVKKIHGENEVFLLTELKNSLAQENYDFAFIEGSGGVASPSINGSLQIQFFAPCKFPIIFIADKNLGGISSSIAQIELALNSGFEIACIVTEEGEHENNLFLKKHYEKEFPVFSFLDFKIFENFEMFFEKNKENTKKLCEYLFSFYKEKENKNKKIETIARSHFWWPFTQHSQIKNITIIDSAQNDHFITNENKEIYDGSQSWWTQNLGHSFPAIRRAINRASGRYGHVMFPGFVHEPAAKLTEKIIDTVGNGWANRVFFSDNGSTAVEVALKMAFRYSTKQNNVHENTQNEPIVLGLKDSYHGDTLGAMDATNPNVFKLKEYWYQKNRGVWLSYPQVFIKNAAIVVATPEELFTNRKKNTRQQSNIYFSCMNHLFDFEERKKTDLYATYLNYFETVFEEISKKNLNIGACIFEGMIQGSCGMIFVDPLFLHGLTHFVQTRKIPVVVDEVFSGLWRLGFSSISAALKIFPHIACYGKGLTGGTITLGLTLAREEVFECFVSEKLENALLHGHSYSANPIACNAAAQAIDEIKTSIYFNPISRLLEIPWNQEKIAQISRLKNVKRIYTLGTLYALEFEENQENTGYTSNLAKPLVETMRQKHGFHLRPLGNVIYLLSGFNSKIETLRKFEEAILEEMAPQGWIEHPTK